MQLGVGASCGPLRITDLVTEGLQTLLPKDCRPIYGIYGIYCIYGLCIYCIYGIYGNYEFLIVGIYANQAAHNANAIRWL